MGRGFFAYIYARKWTKCPFSITRESLIFDSSRKTQGRDNMRIRKSKHAKRFREILGLQRYGKLLRKLHEGLQVWVFVSEEEVDACGELNSFEKEVCRKRLAQGSRCVEWITEPEIVTPETRRPGAIHSHLVWFLDD